MSQKTKQSSKGVKSSKIDYKGGSRSLGITGMKDANGLSVFGLECNAIVGKKKI